MRRRRSVSQQLRSNSRIFVGNHRSNGPGSRGMLGGKAIASLPEAGILRVRRPGTARDRLDHQRRNQGAHSRFAGLPCGFAQVVIVSQLAHQVGPAQQAASRQHSVSGHVIAAANECGIVGKMSLNSRIGGNGGSRNRRQWQRPPEIRDPHADGTGPEIELVVKKTGWKRALKLKCARARRGTLAWALGTRQRKAPRQVRTLGFLGLPGIRPGRAALRQCPAAGHQHQHDQMQ